METKDGTDTARPVPDLKMSYSRNRQARDLSVEESESAWRCDGYGAVTASIAQPRWPARVPPPS